MPDRISALAPHWVPGQYGRVGKAGIVLHEVAPLLMHQICAWPDTFESVRRQACDLAGAGSDGAAGASMEGSRGSLLHVEPLKWWLIGVEADGLTTLQCPIQDISHTHICLRVSGARAPDLLNRHLPLDLRAQSCAPGSVHACGLEHIGVKLWCRQRGYDLFLPRSFALSLFVLLCESAEQFGYELQNPSGNTVRPK